MKNNKKRGRVLMIISIVILLLLILLLFIAYAYTPKETGYQSKYLETIESKYLKMDSYNAHYIQSGEGEPVIFIHGGGSWLYSFRDNMPAISAHYSAYAIDMPGFGYTEILQDNPKYDLDMYSDFMLEFLNAQNLDKVTLVGNSWGGGWSLYFAEKYPERVKKLILIDSSGVALHDVLEWEMFKIPVIGEATSKFINYDSVKYSLQKVFFHQEKVDETMINEIETPLLFKNNLKAQYLAERNLDWKITLRDLPKVKCPTLIIWGKEDKYLDVKYAYEFKKKIQGSELLLIDNCGHVAHEDSPELVNEAVIDFMGK